jgi:hypothetical protein
VIAQICCIVASHNDLPVLEAKVTLGCSIFFRTKMKHKLFGFKTNIPYVSEYNAPPNTSWKNDFCSIFAYVYFREVFYKDISSSYVKVCMKTYGGMEA